MLSTSFWIHQEWNDSSLSWRPEDFGGISEIKVPADMVWKPDMGKQGDIGHGEAGHGRAEGVWENGFRKMGMGKRAWENGFGKIGLGKIGMRKRA